MKDKILLTVTSPVIFAGFIWEIVVTAFNAGRFIGKGFI